FIVILVFSGRFKAGDFLQLTLILYLTLLAGISIGLFFSALVNSTEKAMSILPLILIPQLLLGGFLKSLDDIYLNTITLKPATAEAFRDYENKKERQPGASMPLPGTRPPAPLERIEKQEGMGAVRYLGDLMVARWSIEALAHQVSIRDEKARDSLPAKMTVAAYQRVFDGYSESEIASAYRKRVVLDLFVLGLFTLIFLSLTMWALKRKDVL
ncbi:MAG: ABC transporter permease, partial [Acidobacteria bacterium]|nr:ABC transporter permease [Acidobacteriota bacterium]